MKAITNSSFNAISEKLRKELPTLAPGETATYELLRFEKDHLTGRRLYGGAITLPGRDRIRDGNEVVEIGVVEKTTALLNGVKVRCRKKVLDGGGENGSVPARFTLNGDNLEDVEWYQFFSLCNYNASNPNASESTIKLIKKIDFEAEAQKDLKELDDLTNALMQFSQLEASDIRMIASSLNMDSLGVLGPIKASVAKWVQQNPKEFIKRNGDEATKMLARIRTGAELGFLQYDQASHLVKDSTGTTLVTLDRVEGKNWVEQFNDYVRTNKNGRDAMTVVNKKLDAYFKKPNQAREAKEGKKDE